MSECEERLSAALARNAELEERIGRENGFAVRRRDRELVVARDQRDKARREAETWKGYFREAEAKYSQARAELDSLRNRGAVEEQAYQTANERAEKLWLELYGPEGLRELAAAYLAAWGGGIPKLWLDAFTALGVEPMEDTQAAFDLAQRLVRGTNDEPDIDCADHVWGDHDFRCLKCNVSRQEATR